MSSNSPSHNHEQLATGEPLLSVVRRAETGVHVDRPHSRLRNVIVGSAALAGVVCGLTAFALVEQDPSPDGPPLAVSFQETAQTVVPVAYREGASQPAASQTDSALEDVKTRNRRLEALVKVLRKREQNERRQSARTN